MYNATVDVVVFVTIDVIILWNLTKTTTCDKSRQQGEKKQWSFSFFCNWDNVWMFVTQGPNVFEKIYLLYSRSKQRSNFVLYNQLYLLSMMYGEGYINSCMPFFRWFLFLFTVTFLQNNFVSLIGYIQPIFTMVTA